MFEFVVDARVFQEHNHERVELFWVDVPIMRYLRHEILKS